MPYGEILQNYEKVKAIIKESLNQKVTSFAGVPSWMMVLLNDVLKKTKKDNSLEVWENSEVYCHGGVNFEPYRSLYKNISDDPQEIYEITAKETMQNNSQLDKLFPFLNYDYQTIKNQLIDLLKKRDQWQNAVFEYREISSNTIKNKTKKYYAHDPNEMCDAVDTVVIEESKPVSRLKRWRVKTIQEKAVN